MYVPEQNIIKIGMLWKMEEKNLNKNKHGKNPKYND